MDNIFKNGVVPNSKFEGLASYSVIKSLYQG